MYRFHGNGITLTSRIEIFYDHIKINNKVGIQLNFDQLEAFIYIANTGSFSKAGELLFLSQPSISSKIKVLEKELGTPLFERNYSNVYLTEEGETFLAFAQAAVDSIQKGKRSIQKRNELFDGEVVLSIVFSGAGYFLPSRIQAFRDTYPNIKFSVFSGHSDQVLDMVLNQDVSAGIVRSIYHPQIESFCIEEDEMILVYHSDHPLSKLDKPTLEDLANSPLILYKPETKDWKLIQNAFKKVELAPNIVAEIDSIDGAKEMVKNNIGASFLPYFSVKNDLHNGLLHTIKIDGIPKIERDFELIIKKEQTVDDATKLFIDFITN